MNALLLLIGRALGGGVKSAARISAAAVAHSHCTAASAVIVDAPAGAAALSGSAEADTIRPESSQACVRCAEPAVATALA